MRIFITSTPEELEPHQVAACDVAAELGHQPVLRDPTLGRGLEPVTACARQVAAADAVLAIVGHRRGRVPAPALGGDGVHPWTWWETRAAFDHGLPVGVLMASDVWRPDLREDDARGRSVMSDFRGELARLASPFDDEPGPGYQQLVRHQLATVARSFSSAMLDLELRRWPTPELPANPYPVLLPYSHPELLAGRDRELAELRQLLAQPVPIIGLHAPSGTGKSSFLHAGLVSALRACGRPVAFDRYPCEPGIARRLLGDLVAADGLEAADDDPHAFVDRLRDVLRRLEKPPVLVLDQFEDLLRFDSGPARARIGVLLAASVQRQPGLPEPPCRWLLAYRQELHGRVFQWLTDVLLDARAGGDEPTPPAGDDRGRPSFALALPHDLSGSERFRPWPLMPLGTPAPGTEDRAAAAAEVFAAAIDKPLALRSPAGEPIYPWRFAGDGAARLARAFGDARAARPSAPLAPELQVVLAHLLERSSKAGRAAIEVPEDPGELIDRALQDHLRRSLDLAFPAGRTAETRLRRTCALLALRELAAAHGRRDEGRTVTELARAIGRDGREVLEQLATAQTRLVLLERRGEDQVYVLSHDRMAEVVVHLVDDEGAHGDLGVDAELLGLRRFVALQRELFAAGETAQSTEVPERHFSAIERHADALLWDDEGRDWWRACRRRRRLERRRRAAGRGIAAAVLALFMLLVGTWTDQYFKHRALLATVTEGEPAPAFEALARLTAESDADARELVARLRQRETPFDVLEKGLSGVDEGRGPALLRVARLLLPLVGEAPDDPVRIAIMVWALDFFAIPDPALRPPATALRDQILAPLRQLRPPPPAAEDGGWADIPAGRFWMGIGPEGDRDPDAFEEWPRHQVELSAFRLMTHEVTTAQLRRLLPDHRPGDAPDLPAAFVSWYQAYTYAAWLGGRLPTEAEWEYAARADCAHTFCAPDGNAATRDQVAWWPVNAVDPSSGDSGRQPVGQLAANPWGLHDVYGNVFEWTADWLGRYPERPVADPPGPASPPRLVARVFRGGSAQTPTEYAVPARRMVLVPAARVAFLGFRVLRPAPTAAE